MPEILADLSPGCIIKGRWSQKTYQIENLLGQGGCGAVYLVKDLASGKNYALKISAEQSLLNKEYQLLTEFNLGPQLKCWGLLPQVYQLDDFWNGQQYYPYLVMEYVEGINLQQLLKQKKCLKLKEVVGIGLLLSLALEKIHEKSYIYGDLKLENLLYNQKTGQLRMIDLGGMSKTGQAIKAFTPLYDRASWGQGNRKGDYQYDLFAFSMLLFLLASGKKIKPKREKDSLERIFPLLPSEYTSLKKIITGGLYQQYNNAESMFQDLWRLWSSCGKQRTVTYSSVSNWVVKLFLIASLLFFVFSCWIFVLK